MAISVLFNGVVYSVPETGEESWGESLTSYLTAIASGCLQKTGGAFTLTADVNFGSNFGLLSKYFSTRTALPSTAGLVRLAVTDTIGWRNNAHDGNLLLAINGSDQLTFNGTAIYPAGITALTGDVTATGPGSAAATIAANAVTSAKFRQSVALSIVGNATNATADVTDIVAGTDNFVLRRSGTSLGFALLFNVNIDPSAAIDYSKLSLANSIANSDMATMVTATAKANISGSTTNPSDVSLVAAGTASTIMFRDTNANSSVNNISSKYATTVTAAATTTLTVASAKSQFFTGSTTQNVVLPDATTLPQSGFQFYVVNLSSGIVTVKDAGGSTVQALPASSFSIVTAKSIASSNGSWDVQYSSNNAGGGTVTSVAMTVPTDLFATSPVSGSPITTAGTLAPTLATQTANTIFSGPASGSAATPTFRAPVPLDSAISVLVKTADYTVTTADQTILGNTNAVIFTLPDATICNGYVVRLGKKGSDTNAVTVSTVSSQTIWSVTSIILVKQFDFIELQSDGANWQVLGDRISAEAYANTFAGYGSTATKVPYFTNFTNNTGGGAMTVTNDSTNGFKAVVNYPGLYHMSTDYAADIGFIHGITLNSNDVTANILSLTLSTVKCMSNSRDNDQVLTAASTFYCNAGDIIRPQSTGDAWTGSVARGRINVARVGT